MQTIKTPRFYLNILEWMDAIGYTSIDNAFKTLPVGSFYQSGVTTGEMDFANNFQTNAFVAILGHNCGTVKTGITMDPLPEFTDDIKVNDCYYGADTIPIYDGFSIMSFKGDLSKLYIYFTDGEITHNAHFGSIIFGTYFDMPNAPNLSLTQSIDYGSTKEFTTITGSSMSNTIWDSAPKWADKGAWELYPASDNSTGQFNWDEDDHNELIAKQPLSRSGRRSFQLSWSFMDDRDLFGPNQMLTHHLIPGTTGLGSEDFGSPNLGSQRITNGNMEINNGTIANNWSIVGNGSYATEFTASIVTNGFSGDAQKITRSSGNTGFANIQQNSDIGFAGFHYGNTYKVSITHRNSGGVSIWAATPDVLIGNLTESTFSPITETFIFTPPNPNYTILQFFFVNLMSLAPGGGFIEFDNVSVRTLLDSDFQTNLLSDDNFFSQVYQKTLAGNIPMVMQIDKDNFNADQFAIVRIKSDTLKATQTAPGLYDISLSLEEVW